MTTEDLCPIDGLTFTVEQQSGRFRCEMSVSNYSEGLVELDVCLTAGTPVIPEPTVISWNEPMHEIHYKWNPACYENRMLDKSAASRHVFNSRINARAPVICLHKIDGGNTMTFALSDALHCTTLVSTISEYGHAQCRIHLFDEPWKEITEYSFKLRIDKRSIPMHLCLRDVANWWDELIPGEKLPVPNAAKTARYCTWYPFHGKFTGAETERQCLLAKELGMGTFAYEAGWADDDLDYQPDANKYEDFRQHVDAIHSYGMPFILWVAPSFLNPVSRERFSDKLLGEFDASGKMNGPDSPHLDPRYPEVRQYLIDTYTRIIRDYDIDGFFFDFMEWFRLQQENEPEDPARDFYSVSEAFNQFLRDVIPALRALKPDLLMEFRQPFCGPHMRRYANMFRAVDCGNCFADNRIRILDIRLLCGDAVAHSDPIMWNKDEKVESAAMQLTHTLFGVPQVSMNLESLSEEHTAMVRTYLKFWNEHRDVILDGELTPFEPQNAYPVILSSTTDKFLAVIYANAVVPMPDELPETLLIVNGTYNGFVVLKSNTDQGAYQITVTTCTGSETYSDVVEICAGLHNVSIPVNGYAVMSSTDKRLT